MAGQLARRDSNISGIPYTRRTALYLPPLMARRAVVLFPGHPAGKVCSYKPFAFPPSMEVRTGRMSVIETGMLS